MSPWGYSLLTGGAGIHGGAELQLARLARLLAPRVAAMAVLTARAPGETEQQVDGVSVIPAWNARSPFPVLGLFAQWRELKSALGRFGADVIVQRGASPFTGLLADFARNSGRRFVFMLANDSNVDGRYEREANRRDRFLYRRGLARASLVIAQTETQVRLLRERYGLPAEQLPSAVPAAPDPAPAVNPEVVFWAGRLEPHKRPERLLEMAAAAPDLPFAMAAWVPPGSAFGERIAREAQATPNIEWLGRISQPAMETQYRRSIALLSTSDYEGFSNTFLEAWRLGVPVVSLSSDPDGLIGRFGLGARPADTAEALAELRRFRTDPARRAAVAAAARGYMARHEENAVAGRLLELLAPAAAGGAR